MAKDHTFKGTLGWYYLDNRHPIGYVGPFQSQEIARAEWKAYNGTFLTLLERYGQKTKISFIQKSA